jgi:hypothetical protein
LATSCVVKGAVEIWLHMVFSGRLRFQSPALLVGLPPNYSFAISQRESSTSFPVSKVSFPSLFFQASRPSGKACLFFLRFLRVGMSEDVFVALFIVELERWHLVASYHCRETRRKKECIACLLMLLMHKSPFQRYWNFMRREMHRCMTVGKHIAYSNGKAKYDLPVSGPIINHQTHHANL